MKEVNVSRFTQKAFAVMFKHADGWTVSSVEFHRETAEADMARQYETQPDFDYKVVPCEVWIAGHFVKAPATIKAKPRTGRSE